MESGGGHILRSFACALRSAVRGRGEEAGLSEERAGVDDIFSDRLSSFALRTVFFVVLFFLPFLHCWDEGCSARNVCACVWAWYLCCCGLRAQEGGAARGQRKDDATRGRHVTFSLSPLSPLSFFGRRMEMSSGVLRLWWRREWQSCTAHCGIARRKDVGRTRWCGLGLPTWLAEDAKALKAGEEGRKRRERCVCAYVYVTDRARKRTRERGGEERRERERERSD